MSMNLKLCVTLRYGTFRGADSRPTAEDRSHLESLCREVAADMGDDVLFARTEPTETVSWPSKTLVLSYSLFHPESAALSSLAQVWKSKLETAYDCTVHVSASTD